MQKVFSDDMTVHMWAQMSQPYGRNSSESLSFNGGELISYNTAVALHYGAFVLQSSDTFSPTTGRHMSEIWSSVNVSVITVDNIFAWGDRFYSRRDYPGGVQIKKALLDMILAKSQSYEKRRRDTTRARDLQSIQGMIEDLRIICEHFGLKFPAGYETAEQALGMTAAMVEKLENARQKEARKDEKKRQAHLKEQKYNFEQWLNGETLPTFNQGTDGRERGLVSCPYVYTRQNQAFLTVHNDTVHTSQGAQAPLEHVRKAFKLYRRVLRSGQAWVKNGEKARLGHFELDRIELNGDAKAGCHTFKAEELERFAEKWKV